MTAAARPAALDVAALRAEFPILGTSAHGHPLVYLDNAATTQKPECVLRELRRFHVEDNSNVHRGVHLLSERATKAYEDARETVREFLGASSTREVVFVRGTTEAINLVAQSFARPRLREGDEILISAMEHHSNIVPWQLACEATGAKLKVIPMTDAGELEEGAAERLLGERTRLLAVVHVSNALGTVNPVKELVRLARERGVPTLLDGAQAVPHLAVDVRELGCDFFAFSGHKAYAPMGIGVLWGREALLEAMPPWQGGGDMIASVSFEKSTWNRLPYKFEAGTPNVPGATAMAEALRWMRRVGVERIGAHEAELLAHAHGALREVPGLRLVGTAREKAGVVSFVIDGVHPHDIGTIVDREGVAVRTGHHCAEPVMRRLGVPATARASFAAYNTREEVDALVRALHVACRMLR